MPAVNHLHLWADRFFYVTPAIQSGLTARSSATLLASASGRPFTLVSASGEALRCTAALVAPNVARRLDADGCGLLSLNIDPASALCRSLSGLWRGDALVPLDARRFGQLRDGFEGVLHGQLDDGAAHRLSSDMVHALLGRAAEQPGRPLDQRVSQVLRVLQSASGRGQVPLRDLAAQACLSPDRLTHLFHEQTGLSIKRYLLWAKIRRAVQLMVGQRPLTEIALEGGFADAAHMSRTFHSHFGLPPSFLADADQVRVRVDAHALCTWPAGHAADS